MNMDTTTPALLPSMVTTKGDFLVDISQEQPVLMIFLRHFGCTFCREALADLAAKQDEIAAAGIHLVLVHMSTEEVANKYFKKYGLKKPVTHVADPECNYYKAFGLTKGSPHQLFGLQTWIRGFEAGVVKGHGVGMRQLGDGFQMPGVFVIREGEVVNSFVHKLASDRPEYLSLVRECCAV